MSDAALPNPIPPLDASPEITELERLAKAATPGPWVSPWDNDDPDDDAIRAASGELLVFASEHDGRPILGVTQENAAYIAAANPETILKLLALLRRLGEREAMMREVIRDNALTENLARPATAAFAAYWQCNWCGRSAPDADSIAHDGDCGVGAALAAGKEGE